MKSTVQLILVPAVLVLGFFAACKKEAGYSNLEVQLTDAPADYQEVNIDLKHVSVKLSGDTSSWIELDAVPGIYNLLGLQNGLDTLIATETLPQEVVKEIRLVLGTENTIKVSDNIYPLVIPSGAESGLKIKVNKALNQPVETLIIDFDAALSVHEEGPGEFKLRPVLKVKP